MNDRETKLCELNISFKFFLTHSLLETIPRVQVINVETIEACTHEVSFKNFGRSALLYFLR